MYTSFDETTLDRIITLLKSHRPEFVSGEKLSSTLGLSRAAVWKNIKRLRSLGYKIESRHRSGYRLRQGTSLLLPWEISDGLQTDILGRKTYYFDTIDSTQNFALELLRKPHENGSLIIAKKQTMGRGRLNRKWISPTGGVWLSILLKPNFEPSYASLFPMITSIALAAAIEKTLGIKAELKWPNDITVGGKKVAGILIDTSIESNTIDYIAIGVGINFRVNPSQISKLINNQNYGVTTLVQKGQKDSPIKLIQQFLFELEQMYTNLSPAVIKGIRKEWIRRSSTIGKNITATTTTGVLKGRAVGIDDTGALLLSSRGKTQRLMAGDIAYKN